VQRQYRGCVGEIDNGAMTPTWGGEGALPVASGRRGVPLPVVGGPRAVPRGGSPGGVPFDWLTFDEGYGSTGPFRWVLVLVGQRFVAEVPAHSARRSAPDAPSRPAAPRTVAAVPRRADDAGRSGVAGAGVGHPGDGGERGDRGGEVLRHERGGRVAGEDPWGGAFRRATVEHAFRVPKSELGLTHFEGRQYLGLERHLLLTLIVMGFAAGHTERLRGEKPAGDAGVRSGEHDAARGGVSGPRCGSRPTRAVPEGCRRPHRPGEGCRLHPADAVVLTPRSRGAPVTW
jgi:hypothetical protein